MAIQVEFLVIYRLDKTIVLGLRSYRPFTCPSVVLVLLHDVRSARPISQRVRRGL